MYSFHANRLYWVGYSLESLKSRCFSQPSGWGEEPLGENMYSGLDAGTIEKAIVSLEETEKVCRSLGLRISAETAKEVAQRVTLRGATFSGLLGDVASLQRLIAREMEQDLFFYVPAARAQHWPTKSRPHVFGAGVADRFPSATFDIQNAGICFAAGLGTACVFHLMRCLEVGLQALASMFKVSFEHKNWAPILNEIASKVRGMREDPAWKALPDCKDQQEYYSQVVSHFGVLKDAWRNHAMHMRGKYADDEAETIFINVRSFMKILAQRLSEPGATVDAGSGDE